MRTLQLVLLRLLSHDAQTTCAPTYFAGACKHTARLCGHDEAEVAFREVTRDVVDQVSVVTKNARREAGGSTGPPADVRSLSAPESLTRVHEDITSQVRVSGTERDATISP